MPISRIKDIKYKIPKLSIIERIKSTQKKRNIIKDINLMIDKFNEDNDMLYDNMLIISNNISEDAVEKEFDKSGRNYLLLYLHEIKRDICELNEVLSRNREREFQEFIDSITQDPRKSIETIRKEIFNWYINEKKFIQKENQEIDEAVKEIVEVTIKRIKTELPKRQERKRNQSIEKCSRLIDMIEKFYKNNTKADKILKALKELKTVLHDKKGRLTQETVNTLTVCFKGNRNWINLQISKKPPHPPIPNADNITNQVIINLYGMITDDGTNLWKIVRNYIEIK